MNFEKLNELDEKGYKIFYYGEFVNYVDLEDKEISIGNDIVDFKDFTKEDFNSLVIYEILDTNHAPDDIFEYCKLYNKVKKQLDNFDKRKSLVMVQYFEDFIISEEQLEPLKSIENIDFQYNNILFHDMKIVKV